MAKTRRRVNRKKASRRRMRGGNGHKVARPTVDELLFGKSGVSHAAAPGQPNNSEWIKKEVARRKAEAEFAKHHAVAEEEKKRSNAAIAKLLEGKPKGPPNYNLSKLW